MYINIYVCIYIYILIYICIRYTHVYTYVQQYTKVQAYICYIQMWDTYAISSDHCASSCKLLDLQIKSFVHSYGRQKKLQLPYS